MQDLLQGIDYTGTGDVRVSGFTNDSREVHPGDAFVAVPGVRTDGHRYIPQAIERGAAGVVCEQAPDQPTVPVFLVKSSRKALSRMAASWYGFPAEKLTVIGVTGTNGKTTITTLLGNIFNAGRKPAGTIGTFGYTIGGDFYATDLTTPESKELQSYFARMVDRGMQIVVMEVSSHALALDRTADIPFAAAIFTNLGRDHLDFHDTVSAYREAKGRLFQSLDASGLAILNRDSPEYDWFAKASTGEVISYSLESPEADYYFTDYSMDFQGSRGMVHTPDGSLEVTSQLLGHYNLLNLLPAIAAATNQGVSPAAIRRGIELTKVPGRLELVPAPYEAPTIFVDYAHTPDALEAVLQEINWLKTQGAESRRIILVFGCGGNRERRKRPEMGLIADRLADEVIVTSDNPRNEDPLQIIEEINEGIERPDVILEPDRREAIFTAIRLADPTDIVLIAGKGHETYQLVSGQKHPFNDKTVAAEAVREVMRR